MAVTQLSNLIEPVVFAQYVQDYSTKTNRFIQSGIIGPDPVLGPRLLEGGRTVDIPHLNDLSGEPNKWDDTKDIVPAALTSGLTEAMKMYEEKAFAATDYGQLVTGAPVAKSIAQRFGAYWVRHDEKWLINVLNSAFANADIATAKSFHVGAEADLSAVDFLAATARMGDVAIPQIQKIVVNSAGLAEMRAQNIVDNLQPSVAGEPIRTYNGLEIIIDDDIAVDSSGVTCAYLFAPQSVYYAVATPPNGVVVDRDELQKGGMEAIINKRVLAMQMVGTTIDPAIVPDADTYRATVEANGAAFKVATDPRLLGVVKFGFKVNKDLVVPGINSPVTKGSTGGSDSAINSPVTKGSTGGSDSAKTK